MAWLTVLVSSLALAHCQQYYPADSIYYGVGDQRWDVLISQSLRSNPSQQQIVQQNRPSVTELQNTPGVKSVSLMKPSTDLEAPHVSNNGNQKLPNTESRFAILGDDEEDLDEEDIIEKTAPPPDNVSLALSQFGINLMKIMQRQPGNLVVSPFSIGTVLALVQQGAVGTSQQQITAALNMEAEEASEGFNRITNDLRKRQSNNILKVGNAVFLPQEFSINPTFKQIAQSKFNSDVTPIEFSNAVQAADQINKWVAGKTNNKIDNVVSPEHLSSDTKVVLVNAVYFKGLWQMMFRPQATIPRDFNLSNGQTKSLQFMRMRKMMRCKYDPSISAQVLVLPFESNQYSLVVILPTTNSSIIQALLPLTTDKLLSYQTMPKVEVEIELPKFSIRSESDLVSIFQQLGIYNIFSASADLGGFSLNKQIPLRVSSAVHSAFLSIDEKGGTAGAATFIGAVALSYDEPDMVFNANRPFLAVLWDRQTSVPLFMAKIEDPQQ